MSSDIGSVPGPKIQLIAVMKCSSLLTMRITIVISGVTLDNA